MGDLISRTELLKMLQYNAKGETDENGEYRRLVAIDIYKLIDYIYHMPTAYDVEAVVAELENIKTGGDCRHKCKHYDWSVGWCEGHCEDYVRERAISIVRGKE